MSKKLILVRGTPGSGKSTLARQIESEVRHTTECVKHLEADQYFIKYNSATGVDEYIFDVSKLHQAHMWCEAETNKLLGLDYTVIVSNTFTTIKELRPYFDIALKNGILPTAYLAQNQFKNVHDVPQESLDRMKRRFVYDISDFVVTYQQKLGI
jgi:tRNA uridine 5-carbamoylmethylation protein Kti12